MECGTEVWEQVLFKSIEFLADSNDEPLAATIDFVFKAGAQCQHLSEAVCIWNEWTLLILSATFLLYYYVHFSEYYNLILLHSIGEIRTC